MPLVSIDLCVVYDSNVLLGRRLNRPAKGFWFSLVRRIRKNKPLELAKKRIAYEEIGYADLDPKQLVFIGVWDHFYAESAFDENISTHYINLPHYFLISEEEKEKFHLLVGNSGQHSDWNWMPLKEASNHIEVHPYIRLYATWFLDNL